MRYNLLSRFKQICSEGLRLQKKFNAFEIILILVFFLTFKPLAFSTKNYELNFLNLQALYNRSLSNFHELSSITQTFILHKFIPSVMHKTSTHKQSNVSSCGPNELWLWFLVIIKVIVIAVQTKRSWRSIPSSFYAYNHANGLLFINQAKVYEEL